MIKKVLIGLALVAVIGAAAGAFYLYQQDQAEKRSADEAAAAQVVEEIAQRIEETLQKTTPVSWVFDADETLLFAIRTSDEASATTQVPSLIEEGLRKSHPEGFAARILRDMIIEKQLGGKSDYFFNTGVALLGSRVSEVDMMRYLTTIAIYGNVNGLENAAIEYFNNSLSKLNSWQYGFLNYAYNNEKANTVEYLASIGKTADQVEFLQTNVRNAALESLLRDEVQKMPSVSMGTQSYTVKLSVAANQQQVLQSSVDSYMREFISLSSNGSYMVDASVAVLNNVTGLITAYIPCRTSSADNPREFELNSETWAENFDALIMRIAQPTQTRYSLQTVKLPNGDFTFESTGQQWDKQTMAAGVGGTSTAIDILQKIKVMVLSSSPSLIQQVKDLNGNLIYNAPNPQIQPANNKTVLKLRQCFAAEGEDSVTTLNSQLLLPGGIVSFEMTRDYTAVVLLGSGVIGGDISADTRTSLGEVTSSIMSDVREFFPTPKTAMYARTQEMADEFTATYAANYALLSQGLGEKFDKLEAMPINSSTTRREFETEYERISAELKSLESFVSKKDYAELKQELYGIKQARAEVLLQYSV